MLQQSLIETIQQQNLFFLVMFKELYSTTSNLTPGTSKGKVMAKSTLIGRLLSVHLVPQKRSCFYSEQISFPAKRAGIRSHSARALEVLRP